MNDSYFDSVPPSRMKSGILPDTLMNSAKCFKNDLTSIFNKLFGIIFEEEIIFEHG